MIRPQRDKAVQSEYPRHADDLRNETGQRPSSLQCYALPAQNGPDVLKMPSQAKAEVEQPHLFRRSGLRQQPIDVPGLAFERGPFSLPRKHTIGLLEPDEEIWQRREQQNGNHRPMQPPENP